LQNRKLDSLKIEGDVMNDLDTRRQEVADLEFECYDFGEGNDIAGVSGWEFNNQSDTWSCPIYFERRDEEPSDFDGGRPSLLGHFAIKFAPGTSEVVSAQATLKGNDIGHRSVGETPSP
jgi:hypothetical protein